MLPFRSSPYGPHAHAAAAATSKSAGMGIRVVSALPATSKAAGTFVEEASDESLQALLEAKFGESTVQVEEDGYEDQNMSTSKCRRSPEKGGLQSEQQGNNNKL